MISNNCQSLLKILLCLQISLFVFGLVESLDCGLFVKLVLLSLDVMTFLRDDSTGGD